MINDLPVKLLTIAEVAEMLCLHPNTVRRWSDQGILKSYRIGNRKERRYSVLDIAEYLVAHRVG